jgi:hypothetical protein
VPKETHNIFKDFEDEMTSAEKKIFSKFYLGPPLCKITKKLTEKKKKVFPVVDNAGLYFEE